VERAIGPIERAGGGPAIVVVHGFTGTPWEIEALVDRLAQDGHAVRAPLLPGHGSTPQALGRARWDEWLAHVEGTVDEALASHGSAVVLGFSLGSLLALVAGAARQHRGVIAVGALGTALELTPLEARVLAVSEGLGRLLPDVRVPKFRGSDVRDPRSKRDNPAYATQPLRAAREILRGQRAAREVLGSLTIPVLVVHGRADETTPLSASLSLAEAATRADVELRILPRSGHLLGRDVEALEVCDAVGAFVRRVSAGRR
jgi:carboxylesterase